MHKKGKKKNLKNILSSVDCVVELVIRIRLNMIKIK